MHNLPLEHGATHAAPFGLVTRVIQEPEGWTLDMFRQCYNLRTLTRAIADVRSGNQLTEDCTVKQIYVCHGVIEIPVPIEGIRGRLYRPPIR